MTRAPRMPGNPPARMISPEDTPPQQGADAHRQGDAQLVQHYAAWDLQHRVKPEEAAEQPAELDARQPELRLDLRRRDGKIDAIDVIDKDAEREQRTDPPAQPWYGVAKCHHFLRLFLVSRTIRLFLVGRTIRLFLVGRTIRPQRSPHFLLLDASHTNSNESRRTT